MEISYITILHSFWSNSFQQSHNPSAQKLMVIGDHLMYNPSMYQSMAEIRSRKFVLWMRYLRLLEHLKICHEEIMLNAYEFSIMISEKDFE